MHMCRTALKLRVPERAPVIHVSLAGFKDLHRHRGDMRRPCRK